MYCSRPSVPSHSATLGTALSGTALSGRGVSPVLVSSMVTRLQIICHVCGLQNAFVLWLHSLLERLFRLALRYACTVHFATDIAGVTVTCCVCCDGVPLSCLPCSGRGGHYVSRLKVHYYHPHRLCRASLLYSHHLFCNANIRVTGLFCNYAGICKIQAL